MEKDECQLDPGLEEERREKKDSTIDESFRCQSSGYEFVQSASVDVDDRDERVGIRKRKRNTGRFRISEVLVDVGKRR
jgi:hypothetical protein